MVNINYSQVQEPDEELEDAPRCELYSEAGGDLAANAEMLQFNGSVGFDGFALLAVGRPLMNSNRVVLVGKINLEADVNAGDYAGVGIYFPSIAYGVCICEDDDVKNSVKVFDPGDAAHPFDKDSVVEYTTAEGLLKLQIDIIRRKNAKSLPETRFNVNATWNGTLKHTDQAINLGRRNPVLHPMIMLMTRGASSNVWIRELDLISDVKVRGSGYLDVI